MSAQPYHKRYHSDALAGFMALNLEQRGAYQTLLDMMYDRGGPLLNNERLIAGYLGCSVRKWRALFAELVDLGKIYVTEDGLISNSRAEKELENYAKTSRKHAENGLSGSRKKAENQKKANENNESDQARLQQNSSLYQKPEARVSIPSKEEIDTPPTPSRGRQGKGSFVSVDRPENVPDEVWSEFIALRRAKRAPLTETAIVGIEREAAKAGWTLADALGECTQRGWQGFKAAWVNGGPHADLTPTVPL
jgi:uncharacterized protein YdaU (DUF1376 family)